MTLPPIKPVRINKKGRSVQEYAKLEYPALIKQGVWGSFPYERVDGINIGRLYFKNRQILKEVMADLKLFPHVAVCIEAELYRAIAYTSTSARVLYYYLKGRKIDCTGVEPEIKIFKNYDPFL